MAAAGVRVKITLACTECKPRKYNTMKNKRNNPDRIEMSKYCRFCKKHTAHKETRYFWQQAGQGCERDV